MVLESFHFVTVLPASCKSVAIILKILTTLRIRTNPFPLFHSPLSHYYCSLVLAVLVLRSIHFPCDRNHPKSAMNSRRTQTPSITSEVWSSSCAVWIMHFLRRQQHRRPFGCRLRGLEMWGRDSMTTRTLTSMHCLAHRSKYHLVDLLLCKALPLTWRLLHENKG